MAIFFHMQTQLNISRCEVRNKCYIIPGNASGDPERGTCNVDTGTVAIVLRPLFLYCYNSMYIIQYDAIE